MTMKEALLAGALAFAAVTLPVATVSAMPQLAPGLASTDAVSHVEKAYWHRWHRYHWHRWHHWHRRW